MGFLTGSGRIGRRHFVLVTLLVAALVVLLGPRSLDDRPTSFGVDTIGNEWIIAAVGVWLQTMNSIRRLHDLGREGFFVLAAFVPGLNVVVAIWLLTAPGETAGNRYGPRPGTSTHAISAGQAAYDDRNRNLLNDEGGFDFDGLFRDSSVRAPIANSRRPEDRRLSEEIRWLLHEGTEQDQERGRGRQRGPAPSAGTSSGTAPPRSNR